MTLAVQSRASVTNSATSSTRERPAVTRMLMDGALERIEAARGHGEAAQTRQLLQSAVAIIAELRTGLDLLHGGVIAASLDDLYDYMCRRLGAALAQNGIASLEEVSHLLEALRTAWPFMPAEVRTASRN
jgi:flagellar secretion chaperone FliS